MLRENSGVLSVLFMVWISLGTVTIEAADGFPLPMDIPESWITLLPTHRAANHSSLCQWSFGLKTFL